MQKVLKKTKGAAAWSMPHRNGDHGLGPQRCGCGVRPALTQGTCDSRVTASPSPRRQPPFLPLLPRPPLDRAAFRHPNIASVSECPSLTREFLCDASAAESGTVPYHLLGD